MSSVSEGAGSRGHGGVEGVVNGGLGGVSREMSGGIIPARSLPDRLADVYKIKVIPRIICNGDIIKFFYHVTQLILNKATTSTSPQFLDFEELYS